MPVNDVPYDEALAALETVLGWSGGVMPVWTSDGSAPTCMWHKPVNAAKLGRRVRTLDEAASAEVALGLPWRDRDAGGVTFSTVLWCRIAGREQEKRAARFRPLPTLALQEGRSTRRLLVWALHERIDYHDAFAWSKRIAYRVGAVQKWSDPDLVRFPCPGTFLRVGRSRPVPVRASRLTEDTYEAWPIVARLKDPPTIEWENGVPKVVRAGQGRFA